MAKKKAKKTTKKSATKSAAGKTKAAKTSTKKKTTKKPANKKLAVEPVATMPKPLKKAAGKRGSTGKPAAADMPQITIVLNHDEIASRAYEVYCRNGYVPGRDYDNWKQAESELLAERRG